MNLYIAKITREDLVAKILQKQPFTHEDIYNFENVIQAGDCVLLYFGGDSAQVSWKIGLRGIGRVAKAPYGKGYNTQNPRYFKIDIEVLHVLSDSIPPKETKIHPTYQDEVYDVPFIGANHFPNQAIAKTSDIDAIRAVVQIYKEHVPSNKEIEVDKFFPFLPGQSENLENAFVNWMSLKKKDGVNPYLLRTVQRYARALRQFMKDDVFQVIPTKNLFEIKSSMEMKDLDSKIRNTTGFADFDFSHGRGDLSAALKQYIEFLDGLDSPVKEECKLDKLNLSVFMESAKAAGLTFNLELCNRFVASLMTKPFVILTGLSGSGKSKLAQAFTHWLVPESQYRLVSVGADWTNNEHLLGYANALNATAYIMPDTDVLELMLSATKNSYKPYFLVLDEMNLSHVERYFADFLSVMESMEEIHLYNGDERQASGKGSKIPQKLKWPKNLFIIGTVNIDETTYMFSPKVLDRAQVIEFRVSPDEMNEYLANPSLEIKIDPLDGKGAEFAEAFLAQAQKPGIKPPEGTDAKLKAFFGPLAEVGAEFGYRTAKEFLRFVSQYKELAKDAELDVVVDYAVMQKLLPKLHGSKRKLRGPLNALWTLCLKDGEQTKLMDSKGVKFNDVCKHPVSAEKISRMYFNAEENGFTSYAEA